MAHARTYADRFGLSPNDIKKLSDWLKSQGFIINEASRDRTWIAFSGNAEQIEKAFLTQIHTFSVNGEKHFANTTPLSIPASLSGIVTGVRGLNDFRPKAHAKVAKSNYTFGSIGNEYLAPGDLATMYDLGALYTAGIDGTGQTLAVIGQTDVYLADLANFRSGFGLSAISCPTYPNGTISSCDTSNFKYVVYGTDPGIVNFSYGDDLVEADIDLEWSGAIAKKAKIIYVNAPETALGVWDAWHYAISNNVAPVITMSYGYCELSEAHNGFLAADEAALQQAGLQGITFLNSSGDSGAAECDFQTNLATGGIAVSYPASSPSVTGVGGSLIPYTDYTAAFWNAGNGTDGGSLIAYDPNETAWNDAQEIGAFCTANPSNSFCVNNGVDNWKTAQTVIGLLAAGGGVSNCVTASNTDVCQAGFAQPSYQSSLSISGQTAGRFSPDVSLLASVYWPGYIVCTAGNELGGPDSTSSCDPGGAQGIINNLTNFGFSFGGTSISTPVFAGIVTLLNHYLVTNGFQSSPGLGNINPALYQMAAFSQDAFHQLKTGSNGAYCQPGTPSTQPAALQCPAGGFLGFDAANSDAATGYNLVNGLGSVDGTNLAAAWGNLLTPLTNFTITPSANQVYEQQSVTFTVNALQGSASGVAAYFDNGSSTSLGTGAVSGGTGTFSTTALTVGTNSVSATYTGNYATTTTSAPAVVTVLAPDFSMSGGGTVTLLSGQTATYTVTVTPTSTPKFTSAVALSCTGVPDATVGCTLSPSSIGATAGATDVTVTVTTSGPNPNTVRSQKSQRRADNRMPWLPLAFPLAGVVMVGITGRKLSKYSVVGSLCLALVLLGFLVACGSSSHPITVAVSGPASVFPNHSGWPTQTAKFSATLTNDSGNKGVTWTASAGTIDSTGLLTAPEVGSASPITVTATSVADTSKTGTGSIALKPTTQLGTYTISVNAVEGSTQRSQDVALTVQ
jgi:subtilase family serine protease